MIRQLEDELFEDAATMFVILKLVKTCASWREENDVAALCGVRRNFYSALQRPRALDSDAVRDLVLDFLGSGTDEKGKNRFFAKRLLQHGVVAAFVLSAENDEDASGKCVKRLERGVDVGRLRVVVIEDAAQFGNKFETVFDARERANRFANLRWLRSG